MMRKTPAVLSFIAVMALAMTAAAAPRPIESGAVPSQYFASVTGCGCHSELVAQWSSTMHSKALDDPIYKVKRDEGDKATGGKLGAFCDKCHGPIATVSGEIGTDSMSAVSAESVTCSFCHQSVGLVDGKPGNTSHLVESDGVRRAQIEDPMAPHPAQYSEFHTTAEICGGCHNVNHPVNGMHLESTYSEWKDSPYAEEGVTCQDCHMSAGAGQVGPFKGSAASGAAERDNIYAMLFVGGQVALGPSDLARERLQSAAEVEVDGPDVVAAGQDASITVTITNSGAGHYLPTGLTEVRQMWLSVYAESPDGQRTELGEHRFGTILADDKGTYPVELWDATKIQSDDRIPPKASVTDSFSFSMPEGAQQSTIKAVLLYKSVPDDLAEKAGVENPTTEMAAASQAVYSSEEARAKSEAAAGTKGATGGSSRLLLVVAGFAGLVTLAVAAALTRRKSA